MKFKFSGNLLRYVDYSREVEVLAGTLGEAVTKLGEKFPEAKKVVLGQDGEIRAVNRTFINGNLQHKPELGQALAPEDVVAFLTVIAGG